MAIPTYWVGQVPARPITITVNDEDNNPVNLSMYTGIAVTLLGSDNEEVDLTGSSLTTTGANNGRLYFRFPEGRSVFNKFGTYLLQLRLTSPTAVDFTDEQTIFVRKRGGVR